MIRINLLPEARKKESSFAGNPQVWMVLYALSAIISCLLMAIVYWKYDNELQEKNAANISLEQEIKKAEKQNSNLDEVREKLERSRKLEGVIKKLLAARSGPTRVLMELSKILSQEKGPSITEQALEKLRQENPLSGYNSSWDVRRLWLSAFREEKHQCTIEGLGKTNEDVAEFLRRLVISEIFENVTLQSTRAIQDPDTKLSVVSFALSCSVRY